VLRTFSNRDKARFVSDFAEQLFKRNREVLHLFAEEAHELMPQQIHYKGTGEEEMLGRMLRLQKLGRTSGIGLTCITQRPASLNKNATTQGEILVAHRILGPQDRDAVEDWIKHHRQEAGKKEVLASLAELKTGEAWLWAPDFPEDKPMGLQRVKMLLPETFDSRRTPKPGERRREPSGIAPVDLETLRSKMAATIERAKQADPRELRREIADLRRQLSAKAEKSSTKVEKQPAIVEVPVIRPRELKALQKSAAYLETVWSRFEAAGQAMREETARVKALMDGRAAHLRAPAAAVPLPVARPFSTRSAPMARAMARRPMGAGEDVSSSQQRILDALAWLLSVNLSASSKTQVALLADQSPTSGGYFNNLGRLRSLGLIDYPSPSMLALTDLGRTKGDPGNVPTTNAELHAQFFRRLSTSQAEILRQLIATYPNVLAKSDLAERAGQSPTSGGYFNNLGRLRSLGVIDYPRPGCVVAKSILFLE
jgi:hypothetical protein